MKRKENAIIKKKQTKFYFSLTILIKSSATIIIFN
jgi:hypothetical protein